MVEARVGEDAMPRAIRVGILSRTAIPGPVIIDEKQCGRSS